MQLEAILFDYGGTLDGAASHWLDRFGEIYADIGLPMPIERLKPAFYAADEAAYADRRVAEMSLGELMVFHVTVQVRRLGIVDPALRRRLVDTFVSRSYADLAASRAVLAELTPRFRLGVVSNFYGNVGRILSDAGFAPLLTVIADSNRVGVMKPDRRIFEHALAALGSAPRATLHVGDSHERDVRAARAVGLRTAWLVDPARRIDSDPEADLVLTSLGQLRAAVQDAGTPA